MKQIISGAWRCTRWAWDLFLGRPTVFLVVVGASIAGPAVLEGWQAISSGIPQGQSLVYTPQRGQGYAGRNRHLRGHATNQQQFVGLPLDSAGMARVRKYQQQQFETLRAELAAIRVQTTPTNVLRDAPTSVAMGQKVLNALVSEAKDSAELRLSLLSEAYRM